MSEVVAVEQEKKYSLIDLVEGYSSLTKEYQESGEEIPEHIAELREIAENLMSGKIDDIANLREAISLRIEACKKQIDYLQSMNDSVERLTKEALLRHPARKIEGLAYVAKLNKKGRKSVEVSNEALIPLQHFNYVVQIKDKFPTSDKEKYAFYASLVLGREYTVGMNMTPEETDKLNGTIEKVLSKTLVEESLKKDAGSVPGAKFSDDIYYLKIEAGKSKATLASAKKAEVVHDTAQ